MDFADAMPETLFFFLHSDGKKKRKAENALDVPIRERSRAIANSVAAISIKRQQYPKESTLWGIFVMS